MENPTQAVQLLSSARLMLKGNLAKMKVETSQSSIVRLLFLNTRKSSTNPRIRACDCVRCDICWRFKRAADNSFAAKAHGSSDQSVGRITARFLSEVGRSSAEDNRPRGDLQRQMMLEHDGSFRISFTLVACVSTSLINS